MTASGSSTCVADRIAPSTDPMMIGLRSGCDSTRPIEVRPLVATSRIVSRIGVNTMSWSMITGATVAASPIT